MKKKLNVELTQPPSKNKQDCAGSTNYKTHDSQTRKSRDSWSDTDGCARNLDEEHKNEEDDDYIEPTYFFKDIIESKLQEEVINRLLSKKKSFKVIKAVMFNIDNHEQDILAVGYENKIIQTKDKWNQWNIMDIQSLLGTNHYLLFSHMAKSYIWIEEKN